MTADDTAPAGTTADDTATGMTAVIGGSGFYSFLSDVREHDLDTPYGRPSAPIAVGDIDGHPVAFLPRHGKEHEHPPHRINYRANLWALRAVGARRIIAPCAVGSLRLELGPGVLVVPDQLVDRTKARVQTYFDRGAAHIGFADPYCPDLRATLLATGELVDGGVMVVIEGPRFSTRAESQWYAAQGWSLVNMTGHPEAVLARELALCYAPVALVTDRDAGIEGGASVDQREVFAVFEQNMDRLRTLLRAVVPQISARPHCRCARALDGIQPPVELP